MNKPIVIARQEFIDSTINHVNSAGLPAFIIAEVLEKVLQAVNKNIDVDYQNAMAEYHRALEEERLIDESMKKGGDPKKDPVKDNEDKKGGGVNGGR